MDLLSALSEAQHYEREATRKGDEQLAQMWRRRQQILERLIERKGA